METVAALLRGINVGGKTVKMDRLRSLFESMGFRHVQTYIQSGNVLFLSAAPPDDAMRRMIETELEQALGFAVSVALLSAGELTAILDHCPYSGPSAYVTVLQAPIPQETLQKLSPVPGSEDTFTAVPRAVYVRCEGQYHKTAYSNAFIERKLQVKATTRRADTLMKLQALLAQLHDSE